MVVFLFDKMYEKHLFSLAALFFFNSKCIEGDNSFYWWQATKKKTPIKVQRLLSARIYGKFYFFKGPM